MLDESLFHKDISTPSGLSYQCKPCKRSYDQKRKFKPGFREKDAQNHRKESYKKRARERDNKRYKTDVAFSLKKRISVLINESLTVKGARRKNGRHWENLVGYSVQDLKKHIESKFLPGMSWDNRHEWHIDHITPRSAFNITSAECEEFKRCWSLENLQPLWAKDNLSKGSSIG